MPTLAWCGHRSQCHRPTRDWCGSGGSQTAAGDERQRKGRGHPGSTNHDQWLPIAVGRTDVVVVVFDALVTLFVDDPHRGPQVNDRRWGLDHGTDRTVRL